VHRHQEHDDVGRGGVQAVPETVGGAGEPEGWQGLPRDQDARGDAQRHRAHQSEVDDPANGFSSGSLAEEATRGSHDPVPVQGHVDEEHRSEPDADPFMDRQAREPEAVIEREGNEQRDIDPEVDP